MSSWRVLVGDCRETLRTLPDASVQCCVTSPPYWGLRDYGHDGQLGLERTPEEYVARMVEVFREVRRVLRDDGTVFLNLGDSYFGGGRGGGDSFDSERRGWHAMPCGTSGKVPEGYRVRDCLCGSLCGVCLRAYRTGISHSASQRAPMQPASWLASSLERRESSPGHLPTLDCAPQADRSADATEHPWHTAAHVPERPSASRASTQIGSSAPPADRSRLLGTPSACPLCGCSLANDAPASADTSACTFCTDSQLGASGRNTSGISSLDSAYPNLTNPSRILKPKDLCGIPWRVAFALQADGWYLRSEIIWSKPNPMPESVTDRPTKAHEYVFLLSKSASYFYDADAILEPVSPNTHARLSQDVQAQIGSARAHGGARADRPMKATGRKFDPGAGNKNNPSFDAAMAIMPDERNARSVWTITTQPYKGAHFATFPPELAERCILAGSKPSDVVLDPFGGSGTVGMVATGHGRSAILCELNPEYVHLIRERCGPMLEVA